MNRFRAAARRVLCVLAALLLLPVPLRAEQEEVNVLQDPLPLLVNREHPVYEGFIPANLVLLTDVLDSSLVRVKYKNTQAVREAAEALEKMLEAAKADGIKNWQISAAYRSVKDQTDILNNKISAYRKSHPDWSRARARSAALRTVAEPLCSEHHTGLAIDINVPNTSAFKGTKQCKWLHAHCWDYGFIVRYQEGKESVTGFSAEEWHIRYVGVEHARIIRDRGFCLEEYLEFTENDPSAWVVVEEIPAESLPFQ